MRGVAALGIGLVLAAGCGGRSGGSRMDAMGDGARPDATDTAVDHPIDRFDAAPDAPPDMATADGAPRDDGAPDRADTLTQDRAESDSTAGDATDAPADAGNLDTRPPDPCASNAPLSTVGCNGEPPGPAAPNTFGGRCSFTDAAAGTCASASHFCVEGICAPLCERTAPTEVSTGGCPPGFRCWNTGILTFCFADCRADTDCATGICDSVRGLCRGP